MGIQPFRGKGQGNLIEILLQIVCNWLREWTSLKLLNKYISENLHKSLAASQAQEMQPKMQPTADSGPALTVGVLLRLIINEITTKMVKDLRQTIFIAFTSSWPRSWFRAWPSSGNCIYKVLIIYRFCMGLNSIFRPFKNVRRFKLCSSRKYPYSPHRRDWKFTLGLHCSQPIRIEYFFMYIMNIINKWSKRLVQFQLFEKLTRANEFQIEWEKPYDIIPILILKDCIIL